MATLVGRIVIIGLLALIPQSGLGADRDDVFDDRVVGRVDVVMDPDDEEWLLDPDHADNDEYLPADVRFRNPHIDVRFNGAGVRLRGNFSRLAHKPSFKLSLDEFDPGAELAGIVKLNLIGEHNDPCIVREKLVYDALAATGLPVSRASHVRLFLNGDYRGLYIHVEEVDERFLYDRFGSSAGDLFKCQYLSVPVRADLRYRPAEDYESYGQDGKVVYELLTDGNSNSFERLGELIDVINNASDASFVSELEEVLDVGSFLQSIAFNVLSGSWDSYWGGANNYFLYRHPVTGRYHFIIRDQDMTFGLNSINSVDYSQVNIYAFAPLDSRFPLIYRMLNQSHYRNLYSHFVDQFLDRPLAPGPLRARVEELRRRIRPAALADTYRTLDFPYIDEDAFDIAFDAALGGHVRQGLKPFIDARAASARAQLNFPPAAPAIWGVTPLAGTVSPGQPIHFSCRAFDDGGIQRLDLHLDSGNGFTAVQMLDDGIHHDGVPGDGVYGATAAAAARGSRLRFYLTARDGSGRVTRSPADAPASTHALDVLLDGPVVLNELMARNRSTIADEAGEFEDWIELWNRSSEPVDMTRYRLSQDPGAPGWRLPAVMLPPQGYLLIWMDDDEDQGPRHAPFKLDGDGEWIGLLREGGPAGRQAVDALAFGPQSENIALGRAQDGGLPWGMMTPTPGTANRPLEVPSDPPPGDSPPPPALALVRIWPNPMRSGATVDFAAPPSARVRLDVVDVQGRIRRRLVDGALEEAEGAVVWDGLDGNGKPVPAGTYFLRLEAHGDIRAESLTVVR
jgi:hypothetical protein